MIRDALPGAMAPVPALPRVTKVIIANSAIRPALRVTREVGKRTMLHPVGTQPGEVLPHRTAIMPDHGLIAAVPTTTAMVLRQVGPAAKAAPPTGRHVREPASTTHRPVRAPIAPIARVLPTDHRARTKVEPITTRVGVLTPTLPTRLHGSLPMRTTHGVRLLLPLATTAIQAGEAAR